MITFDTRMVRSHENSEDRTSRGSPKRGWEGKRRGRSQVPTPFCVSGTNTTIGPPYTPYRVTTVGNRFDRSWLAMGRTTRTRSRKERTRRWGWRDRPQWRVVWESWSEHITNESFFGSPKEDDSTSGGVRSPTLSRNLLVDIEDMSGIPSDRYGVRHDSLGVPRVKSRGEGDETKPSEPLKNL